MDFLRDAKSSFAASTDTSDNTPWTSYAVDSLNAALIALAEAQRELVAEQRKTNEILVSMIRVEHGSLAAGSVLENFTQHPRSAGDEG